MEHAVAVGTHKRYFFNLSLSSPSQFGHRNSVMSLNKPDSYTTVPFPKRKTAHIASQLPNCSQSFVFRESGDFAVSFQCSVKPVTLTPFRER